MNNSKRIIRNFLTILLLLPITSCSSEDSNTKQKPDIPTPGIDIPDHPEETGKEYEYDVVVYGGTSPGVTAAIAAKRNGAKSVALISSTNNLGGLTTSGLGATDMMNYKVIGGIAREFYQKVYDYYDTDSTDVWFTSQNRNQYFNETNLAQGKIFYGKNDSVKMQWVFEPHVAIKIIDDMLEEAGVTVVRKTPIKLHGGVELDKETKEITKIKMVNGDSYKAKVFIDASYEGDLMAQAGVTYVYGRESNSQYNEQFNGVFRNDEATVNVNGRQTSPYIVPNDKNSGLLPFIEDSVPGEAGVGDSRMQAYTYRFTLSSDPNNQLPITKTDNYHPEWFEIFGRQFEHGLLNANPLTFNLMPNLKTDTNQADFVGASHDYPEANYEERARIEEMHKQYCLDYMYFLANDSRVSQTAKTEMRRWGLALDEFLDSDYFPTAIYLREGRRMVSDYVMTEMNVINEADRKIDAPYSIGQGMYNCDSHWVTRFVDGDNFGYLEEGSYWKSKRNYPISYKSICPKKGETTNLYVTCCLSSTHAAYGSIRMEPVYMVIGESAGTAAALIASSATKIATQDLSYSFLSEKLVANKQLLGTIVIPEGDDPGTEPDLPPEKEQIVSIASSRFTPIGTTKTSSNYTYDGNPIRITNTLNSGGKFTPRVDDGEYEIFVYNQYAGASNDDPTYNVIIHHTNETTDTFELDASGSANKEFVSIGKYSDIKYVEIIKNLNTTKYIRISAVKFVDTDQMEGYELLNSNYKKAHSLTYVNFHDSTLKELVAKEIGSTNGEVTFEQIKELTSLSTPNNDPATMIRDLTGLEHAINLVNLNIDYNKVKDLTPIKKLPVLTNLNISYNPITDLSAVGTLSELKTLTAIGVGDFKPDFSVIGKLRNLTKLNLAINNINDISFISNLKNLKDVYLSFNRIKDISCLSGLSLNVLAIDNNNVDDFSPLESSTITTLYNYRQNVN